MATALVQTTLSAAVTVNATVIRVASANGISAPAQNFVQQLYVINPNQMKGELMNVVSVNGTSISVSRLAEFKQGFLSGAIVLISPIDASLGNGFQECNPYGTVNKSLFTPWVNIVTGEQWLYSSVTSEWVRGWNNPGPKGVTAAVLSVANPVLPTGPMFHITSTAAITGFTYPVGFTGGSFDVIPDGVFTWTTGDGSIALAGTAVVNKTLTFTWDSSVSKWTPSYIA